MVKELVQILFPYLVVFRARLEIHQKGLFVDGAQMKDGKDENIEAFWIDNDDVSQCENNLMVTKSLKIKKGNILDSFCKDKFEDYKCWREYKGIWLYIFTAIYEIHSMNHRL